MAAGRELVGLSGYPSSSDDENDESQRITAQDWQQLQEQTSRDREGMMVEHDARRQLDSSYTGQEINMGSLFSNRGRNLQENASRRQARAAAILRRRLAETNERRSFARELPIFARGSVVHESVIDLREPSPRPSASADIEDIMAIRRLSRELNMSRRQEFRASPQLPASRTSSNPALAGYGRNSILSPVMDNPSYQFWSRRYLDWRATLPPQHSAPPGAEHEHEHEHEPLLAASPSPPPAPDRPHMDVNDNDNNNHHYEQEADNAQFERLSPRLIAERSDNNPVNLEAGENADRISSPPVESVGDDSSFIQDNIPADVSSDMPIDLSEDMPADESAEEPGERTADDLGDRSENRAANELNERPADEPSDTLTDEPDNRPVDGDDDLELTSVDASGSEVVLINNSNTYGESRTVNESTESQTSSRRNKRKRQYSEANPSNDSSDLVDFNEKLLRLLECPVCLEWMEPPMCQCRRGHLVCTRCRARLAACPVCRTGFSSVRNRAMESVAELLRYPCRHGCGHRARLRRRAAHEASCEARRYHCPAPACAPAPPFALAALYAHLQRVHAAMIKIGRKHNFSVKLNTHVHEDWILKPDADSGLFHLRLDVKLRTWGIVLFVAYIGPKYLAKDYNYEVTVVGQHNGRRLVYSRAVHSDVEGTSVTVMRQDCFHLTLDAAVNYLRVRNKSCERDRSLDFTVEISKRDAAIADNSSVIYLRVRNNSCERDLSLDFIVEISKRDAAMVDNSSVIYLRVCKKSCERDRSLDFSVEISKRDAALADKSLVIVSDD